MKTCARCDREYDDSYDACPRCIARRPVRVLAWLLLIAAILMLCVSWPLAFLFGALAFTIAFFDGITGFVSGIIEGLR